jgi:hypothetical protein
MKINKNFHYIYLILLFIDLTLSEDKIVSITGKVETPFNITSSYDLFTNFSKNDQNISSNYSLINESKKYGESDKKSQNLNSNNETEFKEEFEVMSHRIKFKIFEVLNELFNDIKGNSCLIILFSILIGINLGLFIVIVFYYFRQFICYYCPSLMICNCSPFAKKKTSINTINDSNQKYFPVIDKNSDNEII